MLSLNEKIFQPGAKLPPGIFVAVSSLHKIRLVVK